MGLLAQNTRMRGCICVVGIWMCFVSDTCVVHVVLKAHMKLIGMILTTSCHAAYSDPSGGLELNLSPVTSPV